MPSLIDVRRRIRSVKNTQQITKAMKMVSAAKLRRAQERAIAARPYDSMMGRVLANVAAAGRNDDSVAGLPLLQVRDEKKIQLLVITGDRGLSGAFNANILRKAQQFVNDHADAEIRVEAIGRKGRDYFRRRQLNLVEEHIGVVERPSFDLAKEIGDRMVDDYRKAELDAVYLAFNEFKSVMAPNLVVRKLLPVELPEQEEGELINYIYEQPPEQILQALLPRYIETAIYRAMLESASAEHAARMTAMDTASSNAGEVIDQLTLNMNRIRQATITREIIEIVSGAAAL